MKFIMYVLFVFLLGFFHDSNAQTNWDEQTLEQANTAKNLNYLTLQEKEIIFYSNLARINGALFVETFLEDFLKRNNIKNNKWIISLKKDLKASPSLIALMPTKDLHEAALSHAKKSGNTGQAGHQNFNSRTKILLKKYIGIGENCDYGNANGLFIVMSLLIDENVESLGHRKNILNPEYIYTGASIQKHKRHGFNGVILYGKETYQEFSILDKN
ncbi:MAG: CAP domain-containing protein [Bacteroidota bacterium]|nr:CAP domain-containing protein [Bacteroidota bacterium]